MLFELQAAMMKKLGGFPGGEQDMPALILAATDELHEVLHEHNWKPWKKTKKEVNLRNIHEELTDVMFFLLEMMIVSGMDAETLYANYFEKFQVNIKRAEEGY